MRLNLAHEKEHAVTKDGANGAHPRRMEISHPDNPKRKSRRKCAWLVVDILVECPRGTQMGKNAAIVAHRIFHQASALRRSGAVDFDLTLLRGCRVDS